MASDTVVQYVLKVDAKGAQKGLEGAAKEADQLSKSLDKAGGESKGLNKDLKNTENTSKSASKGMKTLGIGVAAAAAAMVAAATGAIKLSQHFADLTNELVDASTKTGIAVETLAGLRLAAEGSGKSFSSLEGGLIKFQSSMDAASKGTKLTADAFKDLEVDVESMGGGLRDADTVFNETIKALGEMENETQRNAIAMNLFGRSAGPALIQSGALQNLESMTDLAKEFGVAIDKDAIGSMAQFQRKMAEFGAVATGELQRVMNSVSGGNSLNSSIDFVTESVVFLGSLTRDTMAMVGQAFENVFVVAQAGYLAMTGETERAFIIMNDNARENMKAVVNMSNAFTRANERVSEFQKLSAASTAPQKMISTAAATENATSAMKGLSTATKQVVENIDQIAEFLNDSIVANVELESQVKDRLTPEYQKQLSAVKELGQSIDAQVFSTQLQLDSLIDITDERALSVKEQTQLLMLADELDILESLAAENRIAEQKEILALLDEKKKKEEDILKEKQKQAEEDKKQKEADRKAEKQKKQDDASKLVTEIATIVGVLETIGSTTPEEKRAEIKAQVDAIRLGISYLPEIFLELVPLLALGILEAFYDGIILFGKNLVGIIKDAFSNIFNIRDRDPDGNRQGLGIGEGIKRFFDPNQQTFAAGGRFIPKAEGGIRFTGAQDGLAQLHRGEFVVPQSGQRPQQVDRQLNNTTGGGMTININSAVVDRNAVDALVREIEIRFNNQFGTSSSSLFGGR